MPGSVLLRLLLSLGALVAALPLVQAAAKGRSPSETLQAGDVTLTPVVTSGLDRPLFLTHAGDRSGRLFIVEQSGRIKVLERDRVLPVPFLDVADRVPALGDRDERGLLGLAFHPGYARNGRLFVSYTRKSDGATVVAEHRRHTATTASRDERPVMIVPQPYSNHNGGMIAFGPDGYLYIGRGDGGHRGDPDNRAQNPNDLLGKILRIDVDRGDPYGIPPDNPYVKGGGRPEVYALGLRNPWRFSFDPVTHDLWVADVGQWKWEEIDRVTRGGNYGWRRMEGAHCYNPETDCRTPDLILPVMEYGHDKGRCSITGGYVYRGKAIPSLAGRYLYGDYCSGELFLFSTQGGSEATGRPTVLMKTPLRISSFGVDEEEELYVVDHAGGLYRLEPAAIS